MHCPHCAIDLNDPAPSCPDCGFHIRDLDAEFGLLPDREGLLLDGAEALTAAQRDEFASRLADITSATGCEVVVATVASSAPRLPSEHVFWLFNRWSIGGDGHVGVLILLALAERRVEVEVGHAVEGVISDEECTALLQHHAVPFFALERYGEGISHVLKVLEVVLVNGLRERAP